MTLNATFPDDADNDSFKNISRLKLELIPESPEENLRYL